MDQSAEEAMRMLDCFASVGARRFDVTTTDRQGNKLIFRRGVRIDDLRQDMPRLLDETAQQEQNLIVRPVCPPPVFLLQLDDLKAEPLKRVQPAAFLCLETSPGNFQAWIALTENGGKDFARRVRKGAAADPTASGATRVAGSLNFKDKYAPHFPRVRVAYRADGVTVTPAQLEALGLVADPEQISQQARRKLPSQSPRGKAWPSYEKCLAQAHPKHDGSGPDISRADFTWCLIALDWGWSLEATAARLLEESSKAQTDGPRYAERTAARAAEALARRHEKPHNGP